MSLFSKMVGKKSSPTSAKKGVTPAKTAVTPQKNKTTSVKNTLAPVVSEKDNFSKKSPQYSQQLESLKGLHQWFFPGAVPEEMNELLPKILRVLQDYTITEALEQSYPADSLNDYKNYAELEFKTMGETNRLRCQSLLELAEENLRKVIFELIILFHINPENTAPVEVTPKTRHFDEAGRPVVQKYSFDIFPSGCISGIEGITRFLPKESIENKGGLYDVLKFEYPSLMEHFQKKQGPFAIKALTTLGSLGGIGHKQDSDIDAQIVINSSPEYNYRWNDGDFFIAILTKVLCRVQAYFWNSVLSEGERNVIKNQAFQILQKRVGGAVPLEDHKLIPEIFPSSIQHEIFRLSWDRFLVIPQKQQTAIIWKELAETISVFPHISAYLQCFIDFFPFLQQVPKEKVHLRCLPFYKEQIDQNAVVQWLSGFYADAMNPNDRDLLLKYIAKKKNISVDQIPPKLKYAVFLDHLTKSPSRWSILNEFLNYLSERIPFHQSKTSLTKIIPILREMYDPQNRFFNNTRIEAIQEQSKQRFRNQMVVLIEEYEDWEAQKGEAVHEINFYKKTKVVEQYLSMKYPDVEIHLFTNLLRNQRRGKHTPFLVSPEGSMAYYLMLNDLLLNPSVLFCGISPFPFDIPHEFKVLTRVGVCANQNWNMNQLRDGAQEKFSIQQLPDWGQVDISKDVFLEHAIPIFLRESEKVSHRNLPKALLNCWWIEMICGTGEDDHCVPTSLTRLLWNPNQRYFIREGVENEYVIIIRTLESDYPQLQQDPWWIKFTEMLTRTKDSMVQKQMVYCFAQHVRISDIINFNNEAKPIWIDKNEASWRLKCLINFYELFFKDQEERINLMKLAQGRDDVSHKMELLLKQTFLKSMQNVEKRILTFNQKRAMQKLVPYINKATAGKYTPDEIRDFLDPLLKILYQKIVIADESILALPVADLDQIQKIQLQELKKERSKLELVSNNILDFYQSQNFKMEGNTIKKIILGSNIKMGGNAMENFIFKYHFEKNFEKRPFQVPLPISKTLCIPRNKISIEFLDKNQKWLFKSIISKKEARRSGTFLDNEMAMFTDHLIQGLARCVFSGYIGFDSRNMTYFEKPASSSKKPIATNPVTHQDLQFLAAEFNQFFQPIVVSSREFLNDTHYLRDIFMVCHVNRHNILSLVVRDNLDSRFVVDMDISNIEVRMEMKHPGMGEKFPRFLQQLYSTECRQLFLSTLDQLKIPLDHEKPPRVKIWVNTGSFNLSVAPKFYRVYVDGIVNDLWPDDVTSPHFLNPAPLKKSFDVMGKDAIRVYQENQGKATG
ncbi:MAG: hypothetical protein HQM11_01135 [SAR324 cluster bacterium]|nr:hypothetical protein [SAR324 cluster bacterium]